DDGGARGDHDPEPHPPTAWFVARAGDTRPIEHPSLNDLIEVHPSSPCRYSCFCSAPRPCGASRRTVPGPVFCSVLLLSAEDCCTRSRAGSAGPACPGPP